MKRAELPPEATLLRYTGKGELWATDAHTYLVDPQSGDVIDQRVTRSTEPYTIDGKPAMAYLEEALTLIAAVEGGTIDPRAVDQGRVVAAQLRRQLQRAANLCQLAAAELENQDHLSKGFPDPLDTLDD
jgi:hypothetical protein